MQQPSSPQAWYLCQRNGPNPLHAWRLPPDRLVSFGRSAPAVIQIHNPCLSREQCRFKLVRGTLWVHDANSSGGTYVNNERFSQTQLKPGDALSFGGLELQILTRPPAGCRVVEELPPATEPGPACGSCGKPLTVEQAWREMPQAPDWCERTARCLPCGTRVWVRACPRCLHPIEASSPDAPRCPAGCTPPHDRDEASEAAAQKVATSSGTGNGPDCRLCMAPRSNGKEFRVWPRALRLPPDGPQTVLEQKLFCRACQLTSWEPTCPFCDRTARASQSGDLECLDCPECGRLASSHRHADLPVCPRCGSTTMEFGSAREDLPGHFITRLATGHCRACGSQSSLACCPRCDSPASVRVCGSIQELVCPSHGTVASICADPPRRP